MLVKPGFIGRTRSEQHKVRAHPVGYVRQRWIGGSGLRIASKVLLNQAGALVAVTHRLTVIKPGRRSKSPVLQVARTPS